jgi:hypothetical protein
LNWVLSLVVLVALALVVGAIILLRRGERLKPVLMIVLAGVMVGNAVLALPLR